MMNFGNRIRELRKKNNVTQEQLANALNLSPQAVSKWEMNVGYPDISLLPAIAAYFKVSMDELFAYDVHEIDRKIEEIDLNAKSCFWSNMEQAEAIYLKGIALYPGSDKLKAELLDLYECHMRCNGRMELQERAIAIGNRLISESGDEYVINLAKECMASIYLMNGRYDDAKTIIESMPVIWPLKIHDRMRSSSYMLKGEDKQKASENWRIYAWQDLFICCCNEAEGYYDMKDFENALTYFKESVDVIERFMFTTPDREYPNYPITGTAANHCHAVVGMAACHYQLGRIEACERELERAYRIAEEAYSKEWFDANPDSALHAYRDAYRKFGLDAYKPAP